ncbi:MAG: hypothetical protein HYW23_02710 [Candidatus Aenigmarchaeota archaeon]|nr:hypothetical protein [Candidatus Aenigmarchaeota archaeon]
MGDRKPNLLGLNPNILAGLKDHYETTMLDTNVVAGVAGRKSVFNVAVRGLRNHKVIKEKTIGDENGEWQSYLAQPDNYLLSAGLEQILAAIQNWKMNDRLLQLYNAKGISPGAVKYLKNRSPQLTISAIPEGVPIFGHEPALSVEGTFEECQLIEGLLLGIWGYQTAVATQASYVKNILREFNRRDIITLEGGLRRTYPGAALAASRAALIGGFDGTSLEQIGVEYPELREGVGGSSGHSEVLHIGNDEGAFEMQLRAHYRIRDGDDEETIRRKIAGSTRSMLTFLIDTFDSNEGVEAAIRVMNKYGIPCQIRNDSGNQSERVRYIRTRLDEERLYKAKIMISDDLRPWMIYELLEHGARLDLVMMGTYLVNPYKLPGAVYKIAADQRVFGDPQLEPVCKVSFNNPAKGTLPGKLDVYRVIGKDGKADRDVVIARDLESIDRYLRTDDEDHIKLNQTVMVGRELNYDILDMNGVIANARYHLELLRDEHKKFRDAKPYPVIISDVVQRVRDEFAQKYRRC